MIPYKSEMFFMAVGRFFVNDRNVLQHAETVKQSGEYSTF